MRQGTVLSFCHYDPDDPDGDSLRYLYKKIKTERNCFTMKKNLYKALAALLAIVVLMSALPLQAFAAQIYQPATWPFQDVATNWWSFPYIKLLHDSNVINGTSDTTFEPAAFVTRAQFVKMLGCIAGIKTADYAGSSFKDVKASAWYAPYVQWAVTVGVTTGTYPKIFQPNEHILRQDIATMIYRYVNAEKVALPTDGKVRTFIDEKEIAAYAKDAVTAMQQAGIISGEKNKDKTYSFHPNNKATREETAKMLCVLNEIELATLKKKNPNNYNYTIIANWVEANTNRNYYGAPAYTETIINEGSYQENYTIYHDVHYKSLIHMIEIYDGDWLFVFTYRVNGYKGDYTHHFKFNAYIGGKCYIDCAGSGNSLDTINEIVYLSQYSNDTTLTRTELEDLISRCRLNVLEFRKYLLTYQLCRADS